MLGLLRGLRALPDQREIASARDTQSLSSLSEEVLCGGLRSLRPGIRQLAILELNRRPEELRPSTARQLARTILGSRDRDLVTEAAECLISHPHREALPILLPYVNYPRDKSLSFDERAERAVRALQGTPFDEAKKALYANVVGPRRRVAKHDTPLDELAANALNHCKDLSVIARQVIETLAEQDQAMSINRAENQSDRRSRPSSASNMNDAYRKLLNLVGIVSRRSEPEFRQALLAVLLRHRDRIHQEANLISWHLDEPALCRLCARGLNLSVYDSVTAAMTDLLRDRRTNSSVRVHLAHALAKNQNSRVQETLESLAHDRIAGDELRAVAAGGLLQISSSAG